MISYSVAIPYSRKRSARWNESVINKQSSSIISWISRGILSLIQRLCNKQGTPFPQQYSEWIHFYIGLDPHTELLVQICPCCSVLGSTWNLKPKWNLDRLQVWVLWTWIWLTHLSIRLIYPKYVCYCHFLCLICFSLVREDFINKAKSKTTNRNTRQRNRFLDIQV